MKIKAIILTALCALAMTAANATPVKREVDLTRNKQGFSNLQKKISALKKDTLRPAKLTNKKKKKLLGEWNFEINGIVYQIDITSVGSNTFLYDVFTNAGSAGIDLLGVIGKNEIAFTVPFLNGYSQIIAFPDKRVTQWNVFELFVFTQFCEFSGFVDPQTGLDIYNCISPTAEIAEINEGVAVR